jgi:protein involved in polysaccharide export with SLBB domain
MAVKRLICLVLIGIILMPAPGWGQFLTPQSTPEEQRKATPALEKQAEFYLQRFTPQVPSGQLPPSLQAPAQMVAPREAVPTAAPRLPEETSVIEQRAQDFGMPVKQFGYSFFSKPPETFLPVQQVPVGPDYVIGPGDTISIVVWGSIEGQYSLTVDRNGQIAIPKVGVIRVSGLNYRQLREVVDREFARVFKNFQLNVTLDNLRTIMVYVVGQARFPGSYAVSSLSTLVSALFAAGGPKKTGSMRDIQVRRGKRVLVHFDMYDFLIKGDKSKDIRLQTDDVIFIPPIGKLAAIGTPVPTVVLPMAAPGQAAGAAPSPAAGAAPSPAAGTAPGQAPQTVLGQAPAATPGQAAVAPQMPSGGAIKVPGIYELKNERTLSDLLKLAGGLGDTAFKGRVQVLRVKNRQEMVLFEDDLHKVLTGRAREVYLVDGDFVKIFPVPDIVEKKVRVAGSVKTTGDFGYFDNMRVKDLIEYAGGLLRQANKEQAEITRVTITPQGPETRRIYIDLGRALAGNARDNIILKPDDYLFVRTVPEWDLYKLVTVEGEVKFTGTYSIKNGETLSSLLTRAGGFSNRAYPKGAVFTRRAVVEIQKKHLKQAMDRIEAEMLAFSSQTAVTELTKEEAERQAGYVKQQQKLLAKLKEIVPLGRVVIYLDDPERLRGTPADIALQEGDSLLVPQIQQTVNVLGAVVNPTAILYDPYSNVHDYLLRAGGLSSIADGKGTYIIKVNGSAISRSAFGWFGAPMYVGPTVTYHVGSFNTLRLDPGDTIVVPEQLEKIAWLREIKDIATIIGQIALTAGVVLIGLK